MKKILLLISVFAYFTFGQNTTANATSIRVFHGVVGGPNVDVYFNSVSQQNLIANNVSPGSLSEYRNITDLNATSATLIVTQTGSTSNIIANQTVNLPANFRAATILVVPNNATGAGNATNGNATASNTTAAALSFVVLNDQFGNGTAPTTVGLLRFVNVASNGTGANATGASASALSLRLNNGTVLVANANFADTNANYIALAPGNYNLEVVPASGGQPIATQQATVAAGQAISLFAFIPVVGAAPTLVRGTDSAVIFAPLPPVATATATSGAPATSGAVTTGAVTSGAVTSGAVTSGAVTSGVAATSGATQTSATTGVLITGFTTGVQRPVSAAGTLRCDVATLGVVCAILFTVFYRRD